MNVVGQYNPCRLDLHQSPDIPPPSNVKVVRLPYRVGIVVTTSVVYFLHFNNILIKVVNPNEGCCNVVGGGGEKLPSIEGENILNSNCIYITLENEQDLSKKVVCSSCGENGELGEVHVERKWSVKSGKVFVSATAVRGLRVEARDQYLSWVLAFGVIFSG